MRPTLTMALVVAALVAVAGVAGYAVVAHGIAPSGAASETTSVGTLNVYMQDAPAHNTTWSHIDVTFNMVQVHVADAGNDSGWITVRDVPTTVDLMSVKTVSALLGSSSLKAGDYTQLRLNVTSATGTMANGTTVEFFVPSSMLRTDDPFNITTGQSTSLTLNLDLSRSIVDAAGRWIFTPVLGSVQLS